ncbi:tape measure protein [Achromobacter xylosoxidans]|uniref:Tape measure domain protein n=1 Tax=Achromobacter xylosoxidans (strain A8) TaxID=762376 RepID=E3HGS1_ACHXA|nr:tape measure protein [Achromobacter xylosoxidans]ADP15407.1 tape measure domain protein [Achromobacter xylosoxidans A8]
MSVIRELVTLLRYQVDESGLKKYQETYRAAQDSLQKASAKTVQTMRQALTGSVFQPGVWGVRAPSPRPPVAHVAPAGAAPAATLVPPRAVTRASMAGLGRPAAFPVDVAESRARIGQVQAAYGALMARARVGLATVREAGVGAWEGARLAIQDARRAQEGFNRNIVRGARLAREQAGAFSGLRGVLGAVFGVSILSRISRDIDAWGQLEARMRQATASAQEYGEVDKDLARISRLTYKAYADNAELFVRTRRTMADLGKTTQDTVDVTEGLSLGMALSSTKAQDQESVISALTAAIMQGKLGMEQYATLMRAAPRLQVALADGLRTTTDKLLEQVKAGKVTTDQFLPALQSQLAKMRVEAEAMPVTIADAMTVWGDAFQRFFGQMQLGRAAVGGVTKSIETLADNLGLVIKLLALTGGAWGLLRLRNWLALATVQSGGLIRSMITATRTAIGLDGAMALRRGPAGALRMLSLWTRSLAPLLRMAAVLTTIYLIGDDIVAWMRGDISVLGSLIGRVEEWKDEIDAVRAVLVWIKDALGGAGKELGPWILKFGTISVLAYGLWKILSPIRGLLVFLATRVVPMLWAAFAAHPLGRIIGLVLAGLLLIWQNWDSISKFFGETWDEFKKKGKEALDGLLGFFEDIGGRMIAKIQEIGGAIQKWITDKVEAAAKWLNELLPGQMLTDEQKALMTAPSGALGRQEQWQAFVTGAGVPTVSPGATVGVGSGNSGAASVEIHNEINVNAPGGDPKAVAVATRQGIERTQSRSIDRISRIFGAPAGVEVPP